MEAMSPSPGPPTQPSRQDDNNIIVCMYKPDCDTGSQLRKAISHIFGRNKTCTRNIPPHVWVHFCRKHYQRSRYRNAQEWARVQCDLVLTQVRRVQDWSDKNKRAGTGGIVQNWSLSMRKREQNRVQEKSNNKKRPYRDDSDDDILDSATLNGTAVPDWLRSKCGDGYSTVEIEEIVTRLKEEMKKAQMTQIPDIEILPNISMDFSDDATPKAMIRRKTSNGYTHKRSQSVGVALRPEPPSLTRRVSQPSPTEKRQRISDTISYSGRYAHANSSLPNRYTHANPGLPDHPPVLAPLQRQTYSLPHRPAFNNIEESHAEESYDEGNRVPTYGYDNWSLSSSQQNGAQPAITAPEPTQPQNYETRRVPHQRSFSEVENSQYGFSRPSLGYPSLPSNQIAESASYNRSLMPSEHSHTLSPSGYHDDVPFRAQRNFNTSHLPSWEMPAPGPAVSFPDYKHMRHQSTPSVTHSTRANIPISEYTSGAHATTPYEQSPPHHRQRSQALSRQPSSHRPLVQESDQAKAVFSERR